MSFKKHLLKISFLSTVLLTGCHQHTDYFYLMTHPITLQKEYADCEISDTSKDCDEIRRAHSDFTDLLDQRRMHGEDFGKEIIALETQMGSGQVTQEQKDKLQIMLAVVGASSTD